MMGKPGIVVVVLALLVLAWWVMGLKDPRQAGPAGASGGRAAELGGMAAHAGEGREAGRQGAEVAGEDPAAAGGDVGGSGSGAAGLGPAVDLEDVPNWLPREIGGRAVVVERLEVQPDGLAEGVLRFAGSIEALVREIERAGMRPTSQDASAGRPGGMPSLRTTPDSVIYRSPDGRHVAVLDLDKGTGGVEVRFLSVDHGLDCRCSLCLPDDRR